MSFLRGRTGFCNSYPFGNTFTSGMTGSSVTLFLKEAAGDYQANLGFPGSTPA